MKTQQTSQTKRGIVTIIGGITLHFVLGQTYQWGTIMQYIVSYFKTKDNPDLKLDNCTFVFQIFFTLFSVFIPIGSVLIRKFPYPLAYCSMFGIIQGAFILISSYVTNFWVFVLTYSMIPGVLNGTQYVLPMFLSMQYFPKRKALVSGMILAGLGLGTLCFNLIFQNYVNPDNLSPKKMYPDSPSKYFYGDSVSVAEKVPGCIRLMALIWTVLAIVAGSLMSFPKTEEQLKGKKGNDVLLDLEDIGMFMDMDPYFMMQLQDIGLELEGFENDFQDKVVRSKQQNPQQKALESPQNQKLNDIFKDVDSMQTEPNVTNPNLLGKPAQSSNQNLVKKVEDSNQKLFQTPMKFEEEHANQCLGDIQITFRKSDELELTSKKLNEQMLSPDKKTGAQIEMQHYADETTKLQKPAESKNAPDQVFHSESKMVQSQQSGNPNSESHNVPVTKVSPPKTRKSVLLKLDTLKQINSNAVQVNSEEVQINVRPDENKDILVVQGKQGKLLINRKSIQENKIEFQVEKDGQKINLTRKLNQSLAKKKQLTKQMTLQEQQQQKLQEEQKKKNQEKHMRENAPTLLVALKSRISIFYMILQTILIMFGLFMVNAYKNYGSEYISNDQLLILTGSIGSIFNAIGRIVNTQILDVFGFKGLFVTLNVFMCIQSALFTTAVKHTGWYVFWVFFTYFTYGGVQGITPGACARFFGTLIGSQALGFFLFAQSIGNWIEFIFIITLKEDHGYALIFWINFGLLCAALIGSLFFNQHTDWTKENQAYKDLEPLRKKKAVIRSKKYANEFLLQKWEELEEQNYQLSIQVQEIKAFLKLK